jgi:hypothetical protein
MRRIFAFVPCLVACAGGPTSAARVHVAHAAPESAERDRAALESRAAARLSAVRLTPPFHAAAESVRRFDAP